MSQEQQILVGLAVGIIVLIWMIIQTKIHTFLALILATIIVGLVGGIEYDKIVISITKGFGTTLSSIGIIIGFGVMMGRLFEVSGAAKRMALCFLKLFGKGREELAMAITGFLVSIPIFCDSAFIILTPLAKAISAASRKSIVSIGLALATGLVITHSLVPPTPGPVGVAGIFGINVGALILWGLVLSVPMMFGALIFAKYAGKKVWQIPTDDDGWTRDRSYVAKLSNNVYDDANLPKAFISFAPIFVPIILILLSNVIATMGMKDGAFAFIAFLGSPIIAVGIGLLIAIYGLAGSLDRKQILAEMETGMKSAGIIMLITGSGGAFGMLIRDCGVGQVIAESMILWNMPAVLLPFVISTVMRFIQGSGTVAMITAASITAPIIANMSVNPLFAALGACVGSLFYSYFNDSFFWVVNRPLGITEGSEQLRLYSISSTIAWAIGLIGLLILNGVAE